MLKDPEFDKKNTGLSSHIEDEFMEEWDVREVLFQFDNEDPILFARCLGENFSLTLSSESTDEPTIVFSNGKGKEFKIFLRK